MIEVFQNMDSLLQVFWVIALIASIIFVIQFVLTLIGMDHSDVDVDFDGDGTMDLGDGMNLFTIKNLFGFLVGFGWAGVCLYNSISSNIVRIIVALIVGILFVLMFVLIYKQTRKMDRNGAFDINDCLDKTATVYLRIPASGEGKGKVQISINGSVHEIDALTDEDAIPSGQNVKIVEIIDNETLKVVNNQFSTVI
ncbi:MAG: serine protease [Bacteroidaceae bacterium]|nr:serine protease [Bacteroidaceae bacterium]